MRRRTHFANIRTRPTKKMKEGRRAVQTMVRAHDAPALARETIRMRKDEEIDD
jgi:hypothetical protein